MRNWQNFWKGLSEAGIEVAVIPGNHDINNPDARRYTADGTEKVESITADEFRDIYADFGYVAADSPGSGIAELSL